MPTFLEMYEPERNDVVYGLASPRDKYLDEFVEHWLKTWKDPLNGETIYSKNPSSLGKPMSTPEGRKQNESASLLRQTENTKINSYNKPISAICFDDLNNSEFIAKLKGLQGGADYVAGLEKTRSAVSKVGAASYRSLAGGHDGLTEDNFNRLSNKQLGELRFFLAIRRACKYGIDYFLTQSPRDFVGSTKAKLNGAPCLHYVLDEITSASIAQSDAFKLSGFSDGRKGKPITTSELRYLFRTWYSHKKLHGTRILFYRDKDVVQPLWVADPAPWIPYARKRLDKLTSSGRQTYQKQIEEFDRLASKQAAEALEVFFTVPTCDTIRETV